MHDTIKVLEFVVVFILAVVGACLPFVIHRRYSPTELSHPPTIVQLANMFAGGVLLGAGFVHMLPDAREHLQREEGLSPADTICMTTVILFCAVEHAVPALHKRASVVSAEHQQIMDRGAPQGKRRPGTSLFLWVTLCVHSFLEGTALGLGEEVASQITVFVAVAAHKAFAAFALGAKLYEYTRALNKLAIALVLAFALATPVGGVFGMSTAREGGEHLEGVFDALAGGTFIYVGLVEIVLEGFEDAHGPLSHHVVLSAMVLVGAGLMSALAEYV